jgi:2,4-dienoyl-CoA reductase-like NADH-dependent reductase (Old Yellow Enzyme family)
MSNTKPGGAGLPLLFQPYTIRGVTFGNRIVLPPMVHYRAKNGICGTFHTVHLGKYVLGGFGSCSRKQRLSISAA